MFFKRNKKKPCRKAKSQRPTYWEIIVKGKGTVAERWPTAEELWNDPDVQKSVQNHNRSVKASGNMT